MNDIVKLVEQGGGLHKYLNSQKLVPWKKIPKKQYQKTKNPIPKKLGKYKKTPKNNFPGLLRIASAQDPKYKSARKLVFLVSGCLVLVFWFCWYCFFGCCNIGFLCV